MQDARLFLDERTQNSPRHQRHDFNTYVVRLAVLQLRTGSGTVGNRSAGMEPIWNCVPFRLPSFPFPPSTSLRSLCIPSLSSSVMESPPQLQPEGLIGDRGDRLSTNGFLCSLRRIHAFHDCTIAKSVQIIGFAL